MIKIILGTYKTKPIFVLLTEVLWIFRVSFTLESWNFLALLDFIISYKFVISFVFQLLRTIALSTLDLLLILWHFLYHTFKTQFMVAWELYRKSELLKILFIFTKSADLITFRFSFFYLHIRIILRLYFLILIDLKLINKYWF